MARERRNAETKILRLPSGQEVLTIYCWPALAGDQTHYTVTYPSRRVDPATPEALREYAAVWAEAAAWLKKHQGLPDKGPPWCCQCGLTDLCGCGRRKNINRGENG